MIADTAADIRERLRASNRELKVVQAVSAQWERSLLKLAQDMAEAGHTKAEIMDAIELSKERFHEDCRRAVRQATIVDMLASANDG